MRHSRPSTAASVRMGADTPLSATSATARGTIDLEHLNRGIIYGSKRMITRRQRSQISDSGSSEGELANYSGATNPTIVHHDCKEPIASLTDMSGCDTDLDSDAKANGGRSRNLLSNIHIFYFNEETHNDNVSIDHSDRQCYIDACKMHNVIPVSFFIRHMHDKHLDLKHHGLGSVNFRPIAVSLIGNSKVTHLDLTDNWLGSEGGKTVCEILKENCFITHLNLSQNRLDAKFASYLVPVITYNVSLLNLNLSCNELGDVAAEYLATVITETTKLEKLNLSRNLFHEQAGVFLGPALAENTSLRHLDLSWNAIHRKGAVALANGLKKNLYLTSLNISWNGFAVEGSRAIGDMLKVNHHLEKLDISDNRISTPGAVMIAKGLTTNETLRTLKMDANPMQSAGCYAICKQIDKNPKSAIEQLSFLFIRVNEDFKELYQKMLEKFPKLNVIHGSDYLQAKPKKRLHPMLRLNNYVEKRNLSWIEVFKDLDDDGSMSVSYEEFREGLQKLGINLDPLEIDLLIYELDRDGDGEINYSELAIGARNISEHDELIGDPTDLLPKEKTFIWED